MSGEKTSSPCDKFQANLFNKSKCQNCFKSRELHLMKDGKNEQAKPIYGGWLCLAPEGTDFSNPMQRSRKWQRRFFILFEDGGLSYSLDELPTTLPQGTVSMNLCTEITDAEPRTGQRNALCIVTLDQEIFIRGDNKEIISGWNEQLAVFPQAYKHNPKKKRKVEPVLTQEPTPAKVAAAECNVWQEERQNGGLDMTPVWTMADADPTGLTQTPADTLILDGCGSFSNLLSHLDSASGGSTERGVANDPAEPEPNNIQTSSNYKNQSDDGSLDITTEGLVDLEASDNKLDGGTSDWRNGRREARPSRREKLQSCSDLTCLAAPLHQQRAKSLDRRTSDTAMTPDLLNVKKGWMVKLDKNEQWKKYWFVLSTHSLRYYKDSTAEEASDLEGEINLTNCYSVSEFQVQRNYGFKIHTPDGDHTLSAMTAGIRKNWIQALMKIVHPGRAPDVASLPGYQIPEVLPKPDVTPDSPHTEAKSKRGLHCTPSVMERKREGHYNTYDWAEFRPQTKRRLGTDPEMTNRLCSLEFGDLERMKRREERRRRYERMLGFSLAWEMIGDNTVHDMHKVLSQQNLEEDIEQCWKQVEKAAFRLERTVPLCTVIKETEMEKLLDSYRKRVEDLKAQLAESDHHKQELEVQLSTARFSQQQVCSSLLPPLSSEAGLCLLGTKQKPLNGQIHRVDNKHKDTAQLLQQQNFVEDRVEELLNLGPPSLESRLPELHDVQHSVKRLGDLLPGASPALDCQQVLSQSEEGSVRLKLNGTALNHQNQMNGEVHQQFPRLETQMTNNQFNSYPFTEKPSEGNDISGNYFDTANCLERHIPPDQLIIRRLSQEVELLTSKNQALNQRNQELLNQLAEADREITRMKSELTSRYLGPHHFDIEQKRVEDLKKELTMRSQQLLENQMLLSTLEEQLQDTEVLLQLRESKLEGLDSPAESEDKDEKQQCAKSPGVHLLQHINSIKLIVTELKRRLDQSEAKCKELLIQNAKLEESEELHLQTITRMEAELRRLTEERENERLKEGTWSVLGEERFQQVMEGMVMRFRALKKLLEMIDRLDLGVMERATESVCEENKLTALSQLKWEEMFWSLLLSELKANPCQLIEELPVEVVLCDVTQHMMAENQVLLLGLRDTGSCPGERRENLEKACEGKTQKDVDINWNLASVSASEGRGFVFNNQLRKMDKRVMEHFAVITEMKLSLFTNIAASISTSADSKLHSMPEGLFFKHPWAGFLHSAATEALYCCHISRLQTAYEQKRAEAQQKLLTSSLLCSNCGHLRDNNIELRTRWSDLKQMPWCCQSEEPSQQDTDTSQRRAEERVSEKTGEAYSNKDELENTEVIVESESPLSRVDVQHSTDESRWRIQEVIMDANTEMSAAFHKDTECGGQEMEMEQVALLRRRVQQLEEQLFVTADEMKLESDGKMTSLQMQHEKEMEKLKATCDRGFASMEGSHQKVVVELQYQHKRQIERLLVERDRLLQEESAATATAIEAIKNAHRLELEREVQRRYQSGNAHKEDVDAQHSEELASSQRELQVLSEQYSMKCLENGHLIQALDAERKALCQCQQENKGLRTRNQELSGHLAAEITRLCSLAKQDALPLSQGMGVYELEITLRVKESEVQSLKQEIMSLKDELQSAQRDKRTATKKYKDAHTELSILRAKTVREVDELRENLRLARQALVPPSP
ncbi:myosin phosphatase Rho-interacting protein-like [Thalassophryne amazonica]|uniref:myosin phosphatase Rho-interacting protein-like n=1 Tax=Thalassophryne amazonica TaxID=390379 RepID=UPI001472200C|nr:myosin phosphatase Rho-interacting protein-like [Thalassophryne amazonica]